MKLTAFSVSLLAALAAANNGNKTNNTDDLCKDPAAKPADSETWQSINDTITADLKNVTETQAQIDNIPVCIKDNILALDRLNPDVTSWKVENVDNANDEASCNLVAKSIVNTFNNMEACWNDSADCSSE